MGLNPSNPAVQLDTDGFRYETPAQLPELALLQRRVVGRNQDGNRVFDWVVLGQMLAVSMTERTLAPQFEAGSVTGAGDEVIRYRAHLVALWEDSTELDPVDLGFTLYGNDGEVQTYTVTEFEQNGFRLTITGERHL